MEWFDDRGHRLALCLMAACRVPDGVKGPNLYRAAQDAVLLLLCRDPLDGAAYRQIEENIAHDRETLVHGFDDKVRAQVRLADHENVVRDARRLYARLRRDATLAGYVGWLRSRPELGSMIAAFTDRLIDGDPLPDRT